MDRLLIEVKQLTKKGKKETIRQKKSIYSILMWCVYYEYQDFLDTVKQRKSAK